MTKKYKLFLSFIANLIIFVPSTGFAKRVLDYVPPPFLQRLSCSFLTIIPVALLMATASYFIIKQIDKEHCEKYRNIFFGITSLFIIAASLLSANDALNDERNNPHMSGAFFSALIIPLALIVLVKRFPIWKRVLFSLIIIIPVWFLAAFLGMGWQFIGMEIGIPTTW